MFDSQYVSKPSYRPVQTHLACVVLFVFQQARSLSTRFCRESGISHWNGLVSIFFQVLNDADDDTLPSFLVADSLRCYMRCWPVPARQQCNGTSLQLPRCCALSVRMRDMIKEGNVHLRLQPRNHVNTLGPGTSAHQHTGMRARARLLKSPTQPGGRGRLRAP